MQGRLGPQSIVMPSLDFHGTRHVPSCLSIFDYKFSLSETYSCYTKMTPMVYFLQTHSQMQRLYMVPQRTDR